MKVKDLLKSSSLPQLEAEILLAFLLSNKREHLLAHPELEINKKNQRKFKNLEKKRLKEYPIAYLIGSKEFYGLDFTITKKVLVPRPETEALIDYLLRYININQSNAYNFLDIGTGSGAIIISLAKEIEKKLPKIFETSSFYGSDVSPSALKIALINSKKYLLDKKIKFKKSNLIKKIPQDYLLDPSKELIISANLPYLTKDKLTKEKSIKHEPKLALYGGDSGLELYNKLFKMLVNKKVLNFTLICEINPDQGLEIEQICKSVFGQKDIKSKLLQDLSHKDRFFVIKKQLK